MVEWLWWWCSYRTAATRLHPRFVRTRCARARAWEDRQALSFSDGLKIQLSKVSKWVEVGMILTNALTLLYGSQQHEFFQDPANPLGLRMPTIEDYFGLPSTPENYDYF